MPERYHRFNSFTDPEPATFAYLRQAGAELGPEVSDKLEGVLIGITPEQVGPILVGVFGIADSRVFVAQVRQVAEHYLQVRADNRVAKSALKWAGRAERRITDSGWENPFPTNPRSRGFDSDLDSYPYSRPYYRW